MTEEDEELEKTKYYIVANVHAQVRRAISAFEHFNREKQKVMIMGAIYDFSGVFGEESDDKKYNRLIFINVNGETRPTVIKAHPVFVDSIIAGFVPRFLPEPSISSSLPDHTLVSSSSGVVPE